MKTFLEAFDAYNKRFPEGFPAVPLLDNGDEWCIKIIDRCLKEGKDVYEMGYLKDDPDVLY